MSEIKTDNILMRNNLGPIISGFKKQNKTIVATNGCFDILHVGHLHLLNQAKSFGDVLVVGINSDQSVSKLKGPQRPVVNENERAQIIASLKAVDFVTIFDEETAVALLEIIKPDIYVKGGDYNLDNLPEAMPVIANGGKIEFIPLTPRKSTTSLIDKIKLLS